ncbi:MAG: YbaN family protein [Planctomycetales bacterium]|nr:YbaN family protein [Planctomycetales bacterium]
MSGLQVAPQQNQQIDSNHLQCDILPFPKRQSHEFATGWKRTLYLTLAALFFVIGGAGVILPVLPCTPFLLLTNYFLLRTSPGLHSKLLTSRIFGPILLDWQRHRGIRIEVKVKAIACVCLAIAVTVWLSQPSLFVGLLVLSLASIGIAVILSVKTIR